MASPATVLICFAMKEEAGAFGKAASSHPNVSILVTGIGRKNTALALNKFLGTTTPARVLTCGFAGGLDPELASGAVVFETTDALLQQQLSVAGAKPARFLCSDRIATTAVEKSKLRAETSADAVEMESAAVHAICRERGIPCATVRVISDAAGEDLPLDFNQLARPDMSLDYLKLAGAIAKAPGKIAALMNLQRKTRAAGENLAQVLAKLLFA